MVDIELINYSRIEIRHALVDWRTLDAQIKRST